MKKDITASPQTNMWPIAEIVNQPQERLDGSGYPRGLSGDDITLEAARPILINSSQLRIYWQNE